MSLRTKAGSRVIEILLALALGVSQASIPAFAAEVHDFNVPAEAAPDAIRDFASQAHVQILAAGENVKDKQLHAVNGTYSTDQGLHILLADSGLAPQYVGNRSIALVTAAQMTSAGQPADQQKEGKKSSSDGFRVAQVDQGASAAVGGVVASSRATAQEPVRLQEVVVTARKKTELLQEVPVPVSVLNANALAETSLVNLRDYYLTVPGFSVTPNFSATQDLSIRGITTGGFTTPTVGVLIDDVTYGNSTAQATNIVPDIDPGDLARIEVLRGPQGTLYGANSMGGLIKYVTTAPSTEGYSGRLDVGTNNVYNGAEPGFNLRGAVNVPLSDTFAVRMSAYRRQDPGYIDNPTLNTRGVNEAHAYGVRLGALWQPSSNFSANLSALYQNTTQDGISEVNVPTAGVPQTSGLGDLQQTYIAGVGGFDKTVQAYSLNLDYSAGSFHITSITGYNIIRLSDSLDYTYYFGPIAENGAPGTGFDGFGVSGVPYLDFNEGKDFSQELRLSGSVGPRVDWLLGGIYRRENLQNDDKFVASNPTTGEVVGVLVDFGQLRNRYQETAVFGDLTYRFTDQFDVQVGGRQSHLSNTTDPVTSTGPLVPFFYGVPSPFTSPALESSSNTFTYMATPRLKISNDVMVYVRLASGFRPGGANQAGPGIPPQYNPDKTQNYELGLKGDFADHILSVDASVYYIDWKNIQFQLVNAQQIPYTGNGGAAKSEGVELSATVRPLQGLSISGWINYNNAVLTETVPNSPDYLAEGERIPNTPRWSGNLTINQDFPLGKGANGFVGGAFSYVGDRLGLFQSTPDRQYFPSYSRTDLRGGVKYETWTTTVYVNNLTDKRGILAGGIGYLYPFAFVVTQPRTIGVNVTKIF
jgi:outer membrane receptor protein involved in Fe transport